MTCPMRAPTDLAKATAAVAREVLGKPAQKRANEWRYGTHGSLSIASQTT
jgi:hypothetical protein